MAPVSRILLTGGLPMVPSEFQALACSWDVHSRVGGVGCLAIRQVCGMSSARPLTVGFSKMS